jgi:hypothetical protein
VPADDEPEGAETPVLVVVVDWELADVDDVGADALAVAEPELAGADADEFVVWVAE